MNNHFRNISSHIDNVYIADYTNQTDSERGVEIAEMQFTDINYCLIINDRKISFWSINLEKNSALFKQSAKKVSNCECMIASSCATSKGWICLIELKYCTEKNVDKNADGAFSQLKVTCDVLRSEGTIDFSKHRVYFNISIPDHSNKQPFFNSILSQNDIIGYKKSHKVSLLSYNEIKILNECFLAPPVKRV